MPTEDGAGLVRRAIEEIWNRGELDVADVLFTPDYVNHGGLIPDLVRGPEAVKVAVALYRRAFPGLRVSVRSLRVEGDTVVLRWVAHAAPVGGPPDGRPRRPAGGLTGMTRGRLVGGRVVESWTRWDRAGALRRLGVAGSTGPAV
jgi:hypothetical protein